MSATIAPAGTPPSARLSLWHGLALAVVLIVGVAVRFDRLDVSPPGLYYDEAYYALDAVSVREGARPLYFEANNGREPLFIYTVALSQSWFGDTVFAVRVVAALYGSLALLAGYAAARAMFGPRVALLAIALQAGSLWAIQFSRIGLRATTLPLVTGLLLWALVVGWRQRRRSLVILGGALLGLCFYTYIAARLIPLVFVGVGIFWWLFKRRTFPRWDWIAAVIMPALIVAAPMLAYAAGHADLYFGRAGQVALPWGAILENVGRVIGMFFWHGDDNWRHNLSGRPVFDPLTALAFGVGLIWLGWRLWYARDLSAALALLWLVVLAAPTAFSDRAPHFLRAIGLMPVVFMVPALMLEALGAGLRRWGVRRAAPGMMAAAVVLAGVHGGATLLARQAYTASTAPRYAFETAAVELAQAARTCQVELEGDAWIDFRMWDRFPSIRYLAPRTQPVDVTALPVESGSPLCLFTTAGEVAAPIVANWRAPVHVSVEAGGLDQTDGTAEPYPLYNRIRIQPVIAAEPIAAFVGGPQLLMADVSARPEGVRVHLLWSATQPLPAGLHQFIHWRVGEQMLAQWDGPLGGALLPGEAWRVGDQVEQIIDLDGVAPADAAVWVGVYDFGSRDRLITEAGDDHVTIRP